MGKSRALRLVVRNRLGRTAIQQLNGLADLRKTRLRDFPRPCWLCALPLFLFPDKARTPTAVGFSVQEVFGQRRLGNAIR
jgi:hypothetical protein